MRTVGASRSPRMRPRPQTGMVIATTRMSTLPPPRRCRYLARRRIGARRTAAASIWSARQTSATIATAATTQGKRRAGLRRATPRGIGTRAARAAGTASLARVAARRPPARNRGHPRRATRSRRGSGGRRRRRRTGHTNLRRRIAEEWEARHRNHRHEHRQATPTGALSGLALSAHGSGVSISIHGRSVHGSVGDNFRRTEIPPRPHFHLSITLSALRRSELR